MKTSEIAKNLLLDKTCDSCFNNCLKKSNYNTCNNHDKVEFNGQLPIGTLTSYYKEGKIFYVIFDGKYMKIFRKPVFPSGKVSNLDGHCFRHI